MQVHLRSNQNWGNTQNLSFDYLLINYHVLFPLIVSKQKIRRWFTSDLVIVGGMFRFF